MVATGLIVEGSGRMGVKDGLPRKLATRIEPYLEDGETVKAVIMARSGVAPSERTVNPVALLRRAKNHLLVVTNRGTVVLDASLLRSTMPTGLGERSRKSLKLVEIKGLWAEVRLDDTYWVHKRFHDDVRAAAGKPAKASSRAASGRAKRR